VAHVRTGNRPGHGRPWGRERLGALTDAGMGGGRPSSRGRCSGFVDRATSPAPRLQLGNHGSFGRGLITGWASGPSCPRWNVVGCPDLTVVHRSCGTHLAGRVRGGAGPSTTAANGRRAFPRVRTPA
jgi:hypothetical protein